MATELAKAYVQIIPSAKGIGREIEKAITPEAQSAGQSFGSKLVGIIKKTIAAAAIGKFLADSVKAGAALEQSLGGIETLFKESADKVKKNAADAYRTSGMSANEYMEMTTGFAASLLQSLGNDTAKAADIADIAMTDMSDNANKMGTSMEDIKNAYQGFAKQNYTMLDNLKLGYGGTKTEMERLLADAQKITGVKYDINNLADVYSAIHVIQGELDITGTTAKEAATTLSGSFASVKAAFENVKGYIALGMDVGPSLNALSETVVTFLVGNLMPAIWNILYAFPGAVYSFIRSFVPQLASAFMEFIPEVASGIIKGAPKIYKSIQKMLNKALDYIKNNMPAMLKKGNEIIANIANGIVSRIPSVITAMGEILDTILQILFDALPQLLQSGVDLIANIATGIGNSIPNIVSAIGNVLSKLLSNLASNMPKLLESGMTMVSNLASGIIKNAPAIVAAIAHAIAKLLETIVSNLPQILQSGITMLGQLAAGLIQGIPKAVAAIPQLIRDLVNAFMQYDWGSIGRDIVSGITNGITGSAGSIVSAAKDTAKNALNSARNTLGIHSPSTVFRDQVGKMVSLGFANGIRLNMDSVLSEVQRMNDAAIGVLDMNYGTSMNIYPASGGGYAQTLSIITTLLERMVNKENNEEIVIKMNQREVGRGLREMGVNFV